MAMQYDVKSTHSTTTGTVASGRNRLKGYQFLSGATAGDIIFRDGGSGGTIRHQFSISTAADALSVLIPGEGILFTTDIHVTLPAAAKITSFYG